MCTHLFQIDINWWTYTHEMNNLRYVKQNQAKDDSINDRRILSRVHFVYSFVWLAFQFQCERSTFSWSDPWMNGIFFLSPNISLCMRNGKNIRKQIHIKSSNGTYYIWTHYQIPKKDGQPMGKSTTEETNHTFSTERERKINKIEIETKRNETSGKYCWGNWTATDNQSQSQC